MFVTCFESGSRSTLGDQPNNGILVDMTTSEPSARGRDSRGRQRLAASIASIGAGFGRDRVPRKARWSINDRVVTKDAVNSG